MISTEQFDSLKMGDLIEAKPLLAALTKEPVVLKVVQVGADRREFLATYFEVVLGKWCACKKGEKVEWTFQ